MKTSLKQKGTALFVVVLLFMAVMLVPAVSAQEQDDTARAKVPSCIKVYSLVELNTTEILERINTGESVNISFGVEPFELKLVLNNIRSPDCKAFVKDEDGIHEIELPEPATYKGKVVGEPDSWVRATITPDGGVHGSVHCDTGWYWIEPLNGWYRSSEAGANITHYTYKTTDTEFEIYLGDDVIMISEDDSISNRSTNDSLPVTSRSTLYADIICDGDVEFYNINPSNWQTRQEDVINDVAVIYDSQMNIDLDSVKHETWTSGGPLTSTDAHTLLNQTREYWRTRPEQRDLVHLFTGKNLDGGTFGTACQPGIGTDYAYSLSQQIAEGSYQATPYHKMILGQRMKSGTISMVTMITQ
jgi:hypothetical protein